MAGHHVWNWGHHVWNWFTYIWWFDKNSPNSPKSPYSPTWLATMYGTDLHTFGDLTRIRHIRQNRHICQIHQHGRPPCMELIYIHLVIWQEFAKFAIFAEIAIFANIAGHHVWNWFTKIWWFDNSPKSPYSLDLPTWLATMYGTDLHTFSDLTTIRQNRHIRRIRQHGWPPCLELIYIHLVIWQEFAKIARFANMAGHHVWNWFTYIWWFDKNSPKSPYSPDSPTWLATMYGINLHTFGDLTRIRRNCHICQNCKNRQIVDDILLFCQFCYCVHFWT